MGDQATRSRSVYIGNLPWDVKEEELKKVFASVGTIVSLRMPVDPESGKSRGFAFCEYREQDSVNVAIKHFNGYELNGRKIRVDSASNNQDKEGKTLGPAVNESQFGEACDPVKAPEIIASVIGKMSPQQIQAIISETKRCLQSDPEEARTALVNNPQMIYALLLALVRGRYITKERGTEALVKPDAPLLPLFPEVRPAAPPPVPVVQAAPVPAPPMNGGPGLLGSAPTGGLLAPPLHNFPPTNLPPQLNHLLGQIGPLPMLNPMMMRMSNPGPHGPGHGGLMPPPDYAFPRGPQGAPNNMPPHHSDRPHDHPPPPPPHRDHPQPSRDRDRDRERERERDRSDDRDRMNDRDRPASRDRPNNVRDRNDDRGRPATDRNRPQGTGPMRNDRNDRPAARNGDRDRSAGQAVRGGRDGGQTSRRGAGREGPNQGTRAPPRDQRPEPYNNDRRGPVNRSTSREENDRPSPRAATSSAAPPTPSAGSSKDEQEKAELIMQVLRLKEEDISKMAPEQQKTVRMLRDQFKSYSK